MEKKYIIFDLDGTIIDSGLGIKNGIIYSLKSIGIQNVEENILNKFIGPPLKDSYMRFFDLSEEKAKDMVNKYREYYSEQGIYEAYIYEGIEEVIKNLKEKENEIILATSKPEIFAKKVLNHFNLMDYFNFVGGATLDHKITHKNEVLQYVLKEYYINPQNGFMIGDTKFDILGGKLFDLNTIGVTYGYGSLEELKKANADNIVNKPEEILKYIV